MLQIVDLAFKRLAENLEEKTNPAFNITCYDLLEPEVVFSRF